LYRFCLLFVIILPQTGFTGFAVSDTINEKAGSKRQQI
jgi:hypothetical protein